MVSKEKSEAQLFMEQVKLADVKTECKLAERQQWHDLSLKITGQMGGEKVQSSGSQSKMSDARDICMDMENEIYLSVLEQAQTRKKVTAVLDQVKNPTYYQVLHMRFIQHLEPNTIADKFMSDYTWATTTQGRALKSIEAILERTGYGN